MEKVRKEGVITIKEGCTIKDEIKITEGMRFYCGFISPYFVMDLKSQKVEFKKPFKHFAEQEDIAVAGYLSLLEAAAQAGWLSVIIAEDVNGEALAACILNKLRGQLQVAPVKASGVEIIPS